ncbi:VWA domain-containing protein, partial [Vibrio vulnificus]|nr:VWA domain-containing protein [Vibrio vulnificus]EKA6051910.1 VWA domain-containing protein [Vibrio vulnificus]ELB7645675.1 VWA domain-containing protein [Vibrio vulnificus]
MYYGEIMSELIFLEPKWLFGLIVLPVAWLFWRFKRQASQGPVAAHLSQTPTKGAKNTWSILLWLSAWVVAILALASPSWQHTTRPNFNSDQNRVLVMDMSQSMYAQDIAPSRLQQAGYKALDLLPQWKEGNTALIAYAGDAYLLSPLTSDSQTLANLIQNLSPDIMPYQGSRLTSALMLAKAQLEKAGAAKGDIIVISDDIDDQELQAALKLVANSAIRVSILGVGTPNGSPIPLPNGSLLTSSTGQVVVAKSGFNNMAALAQNTGGYFAPIQFSNQDVVEIAAATQANSEMHQAKANNTQQSEVRENGGYWLLPLLLLAGLGLFRRGFVWMAFVLSLPLTQIPSAHASAFLTADQQGKSLFDQGQYKAAAEQFSNPQWKGSAAYKAGEYEQAATLFAQSDSAESLYNLGNALAQNGQYDDALEAYQKALAKNPNLKQAKTNREVVEKA